jgi:hypothetical protein
MSHEADRKFSVFRALGSALELLMDGIVLPDGAARIIHANISALRHLRCAMSLRQERERLAAREHNIWDAIVAAVRDAERLERSRPFILKDEKARDLASWIMPLA